MASEHEPDHGSAISGHTALERALQAIVHVYHEHSQQEKKRDLLNLTELTGLLKTQAPGFLSVCDRHHPGYIKELFKKADTDKNKQLTFGEFIGILGKLADDAHRLSHGDDRCGADRH